MQGREDVSPKEIEQVLYELDEIEEAAVVGVEDDIDGMAIKAVVSRAGGAARRAARTQPLPGAPRGLHDSEAHRDP